MTREQRRKDILGWNDSTLVYYLEQLEQIEKNLKDDLKLIKNEFKRREKQIIKNKAI